MEDGFLILAACSLIATTVFSYIDLSNLYSALLVVLGSSDTTNLFNVLALIETSTKISEALSTLWWLVLFPVKLAYLFFFRKLIDRLPRLKIYWWFMISFIVSYTKESWLIRVINSYNRSYPWLSVLQWHLSPVQLLKSLRLLVRPLQVAYRRT